MWWPHPRRRTCHRPDVHRKTMDALIFDLDGTLYSHANGYEAHFRSKIFEYMRTKLGVEDGREEAIWKELFQVHNQSLKGLRAGGYVIDDEEYWEFIRGGTDEYLKPDARVHRAVEAMPCRRRVVFTNCNEKQAWKAICSLQLDKYFREEDVFGASFMGNHCKPEEVVFKKLLQAIDARPEKCAMFEDSLKNLKQAKAMGMTTIFVTGPQAQASDSVPQEATKYADAVVAECTFDELSRKIPTLFHAQTQY